MELRSRFLHSPKSKVLGLWTLGFGSWLWVMDFALSVLSFGLWALGFEFQISDFKFVFFWFLEFTPRFPHSPKSKVLGLWVMDFAFSVLSFGLWALGFGFWTLHFTFECLGFWTVQWGFCTLGFEL